MTTSPLWRCLLDHGLVPSVGRQGDVSRGVCLHWLIDWLIDILSTPPPSINLLLLLPPSGANQRVSFTVSANSLQEFVMTINCELMPIQMSIRKSVQELASVDVQCFVLVNLLTGETTRWLISNFLHCFPVLWCSSYLSLFWVAIVLPCVRACVGNAGIVLACTVLTFSFTPTHRNMSTFSPPELAFFRRIIEEVVKSDTGEIRAMEAINLACDVPSFRMKEAEETLERLVQDKWLIKVHICVYMHDMCLSWILFFKTATYMRYFHSYFGQKHTASQAFYYFSITYYVLPNLSSELTIYSIWWWKVVVVQMYRIYGLIWCCFIRVIKHCPSVLWPPQNCRTTCRKFTLMMYMHVISARSSLSG